MEEIAPNFVPMPNMSTIDNCPNSCIFNHKNTHSIFFSVKINTNQFLFHCKHLVKQNEINYSKATLTKNWYNHGLIIQCYFRYKEFEVSYIIFNKHNYSPICLCLINHSIIFLKNENKSKPNANIEVTKKKNSTRIIRC